MEFNRNCVIYQINAKQILQDLSAKQGNYLSIKEMSPHVFLINFRWITTIPVLQRKVNQFHDASILLFEKEQMAALFHFPEEEGLKRLNEFLTVSASFAKIDFYQLFKDQLFSNKVSPFIIHSISCPRRISTVFFFDEDHISLDTLQTQKATEEELFNFLYKRPLLKFNISTKEDKPKPFLVHDGNRLEFYDTQTDEEVISLLQSLLSFYQV